MSQHHFYLNSQFIKFNLIIDGIEKEKVENQDLTMREGTQVLDFFVQVDMIFLIKVSQSFFESLYSMGHKILHGMTLFITISNFLGGPNATHL